jgi:uncharacterized protein
VINALTGQQKENTALLIRRVRKAALEYVQQHSYAGHDQTHTIRVHRLSRMIGKKEKADLLILEAAALLHDVGRSHDQLNHAEKSAEIAEVLLRECDFPLDRLPQVLYAIRMHRFSRGVEPDTLEAKILQDADRIDISGAIGVGMTFAYGGSKNMEMYNEDDPLAKNRKLDDTKYVLDHFQTKLLKLPKTIHTKTGKQLIRKRSRYLKSFMSQFIREITTTN